jgi:hypothetical protein
LNINFFKIKKWPTIILEFRTKWQLKWLENLLVHTVAISTGMTIAALCGVQLRVLTVRDHHNSDEALAVYMLRQTSLFKDAGLVRSRDPAKLAEADVIVDVGGVYDSSAHKYDHHQRGFFETFDDKHKTKLSSAGLIYK